MDTKRRIEQLATGGQWNFSGVLYHEHPTGLAAIRLMLLTGFRRMEVLGLKRPWFSRSDHCIRFPDTKSGAQVRALGEAAMDCIEVQPIRAGCVFVFPADWGDGHFIGVVRVLDRICRKAKLEGVTPHVLRHTFANVAGDLGFSELTIAGLHGHSAHGVTQRYVHLDTALVVAADRVSMEIASMLGHEAPTEKSGNTSCEHLALQPADAALQSVEDFNFSSLTIDFSHRRS